MKTIATVTAEIIQQSSFLEEALVEDLINVSSLARKIKNRVEEELGKSVKEGAIVMAINRYSPVKILSLDRKILHYMSELGDFTVRSNIFIRTFEHDINFSVTQERMLKDINIEKGSIFTLSQGVFETTIIASERYMTKVDVLLKKEKIVFRGNSLSLVSMKLPHSGLDVPGAYYYILKQLAWEKINVIEVNSTTNELTIIVNNTDIEKAFSVLNKLKTGVKY